MNPTLPDQTKLIVVLGGARAGKSAFALHLASSLAAEGQVCFVATAQALDVEMTDRIAKHRAERPSHWKTIEEPYQLDAALVRVAEANVAIIDCLTLFVANWLVRSEGDETQCAQIVQRICERVVARVRSQMLTAIFVSNEVGLGIVPENRAARIFRDLLGRVNQQFVAAADEVYLLVAGLPLQVKP